MEETISDLADSIYREKVRRARSMPSSKKMGLGAQLFSDVCSRMRSGIRAQFPDADDEKVEAILRERLDRIDRLHDHGIFKPVPSK